MLEICVKQSRDESERLAAICSVEGLLSGLKSFSELGFGETMMSGGPESLVERGLEKEPPTKASAAEAVLMGALAQGVNAPTWTFLRVVLLALAASLMCLLAVASKISGFGPLLHVMVLIMVVIILFLLLNCGVIMNMETHIQPLRSISVRGSRFISETGIVPVEQQMAELNLTDADLGHSDSHID